MTDYAQLWKNALLTSDPNAVKIYKEWLDDPNSKTDANLYLGQVMIQAMSKSPASRVHSALELYEMCEPKNKALHSWYKQETISCLKEFGYPIIAKELELMK